MPTIAIVGAGPGLGLEIARVFGNQGFAVALLARSQSKLDGLASTLGAEDIEAAGFAADITDPNSLASGFAAIADRFGAVDVLEFSPAPGPGSPGMGMVDVLELSRENVQPQLDFYLFGGIVAAEQVLPAMIEAGAGTLIFTTGGGSVTPIPMLGNVNVADQPPRGTGAPGHLRRPHGDQRVDRVRQAGGRGVGDRAGVLEALPGA
jgi:NAD(P)-dependent dehydrogenase (short-subunit alcohol dehydrogenase family)